MTAGAAVLILVAGSVATVLFLQPWLSPEQSGGSAQQEPEEPVVYGYRVVQRFTHDDGAYTQGLLWLNGSLYESTGDYRRSSVREVQLGKNGKSKVVRKAMTKAEDAVGDDFFGEGLVWSRGELLQLLWERPDGVRFRAQAGKDGSLERVAGGDFKTPLKDGWGLTTDDEVLFATDSGHNVFHLDPETFALRRTVPVTDEGEAIEMLNELEMIDGEMWANVYEHECLARVNPYTGRVLGWVVLDGLLDRRAAGQAAREKGVDPPEELNGIAWDPEDRRLFVTGKLWPTLFEIEVFPHPKMDLEAARRHCIPTEGW